VSYAGFRLKARHFASKPRSPACLLTRFAGFSAQADPGSGNVKALRGPWNDRWFWALESFPEDCRGDEDDSDAGANGLVGKFGPGEALLATIHNEPKMKATSAAPIVITYAHARADSGPPNSFAITQIWAKCTPKIFATRACFALAPCQ